jgi:hypothetical protein
MGSRGALWMVTLTATACGRIDFGPLADPDAAAGTFCETLQPAPTFCQDFEQGLVVAADPGPNASIEAVELNGGALSLSSSAFDGSGALEASFADVPPSYVALASVTWAATAIARKYTLDYYLDIAERPTAGHLECMLVALHVAGVGEFYYDLNLLSAPPDHFLEEEMLDVGTFMAGEVSLETTLTPGTWHHVVMTLDFDAGTHSFSVDDVVLHAGANSFPAAPGTISLDTGITWEVDSTTPNHILVDNVALYLE